MQKKSRVFEGLGYVARLIYQEVNFSKLTKSNSICTNDFISISIHYLLCKISTQIIEWKKFVLPAISCNEASQYYINFMI